MTPSAPPERSRRGVPLPEHPHCAYASPFWPFVFALTVLSAFVAVLINAQRIDALGGTPMAALSTSCTAPAAEGERLVVTFTLRGNVIDITCRPISGSKS